MRETKGITLVALVITVIVLLILAGITIAMLTGENGILNRAKQATQVYENSVKEENEILSGYEGELDIVSYNPEKGVNAPKLVQGMIPIKWDNEKSTWVVCEETDPDWYNYINTAGQNMWANVMLSDGQANKEVGDTVTDEELGSMFVWIPRYAYSIKEYHAEKDGTEGQANVGITDISFLRGTTNSDGTTTYREDYNADEVQQGSETPKIVHPAFNFGGKELSGIWVAKFEASMEEENTNTSANNDVTNKTIKILPNKDSWRYIQIGTAFTNCLNMKQEGNPYKLSNVDSHLMKNSEWGAVAYIAVSQYGYIPTINNEGESYTDEGVTKYHGYTGGNDYKANVTQSTTGNITGIYDLNGGAYERVAAYWDNGSSYLSSYVGETYFPNNKLNEKYSKYWDKYEVPQQEIEEMANGLWDKGVEANPIREQIATGRYNLMKGIKGDALYETIKTYSYYGKNAEGEYNWILGDDYETTQYGINYYNNDQASVGNDRLLFLCRSGSWRDSPGDSPDAVTGVFHSHSNNGYRTSGVRFPSGIV